MPHHILQLISSSGFFGAENVLLALSQELKKSGHSVTVGIFHNLHNPNLELADKARALGLDTRVFQCKGKVDLRTLVQINRFLKETGVDIIHSHGYKSNIYAVLSNRPRKRSLVATCHNWINSNTKMSFYTYLDKIFLKQFDRVVPVSKTVEETLLSAGIKRSRLHRIENGIHVSKFHLDGDIGNALRKELGISIHDRVIGTVGRLTEEKGHTYLLKAAQKLLATHPDCFFLIVGDGKLKAALELEAEQLNIRGKILFTGTRDNIPDLLSVMDIFVLPSLTEGQPMALLEAMAAGRFAVATGVGDVPKILRHRELGYIVPPRDPDGLLEGFLFYLNHREEGDNIGLKAYHEVVDKYSSSRMALEYLQLYNQLRS